MGKEGRRGAHAGEDGLMSTHWIGIDVAKTGLDVARSDNFRFRAGFEPGDMGPAANPACSNQANFYFLFLSHPELIPPLKR